MQIEVVDQGFFWYINWINCLEGISEKIHQMIFFAYFTLSCLLEPNVDDGHKKVTFT